MARWCRITLAVAGLAACGRDHPLSAPAPRAAAAPNVNVLPAAYYTSYTWGARGQFADVNDQNLIVGVQNDQAMWMYLGGPLKPLSNGGGSRSMAEGVNYKGAIAGSVDMGTWQAPHWAPAVWDDPYATPHVVADTGYARDINDLGVAVGIIFRKGRPHAFAWAPGHGASSVTILPPLPGDKFGEAIAISPDNIILGYSESSAYLKRPVLWHPTTSGWTPQLIRGGIQGWDIDHGVGIVGWTLNSASFGQPHHTGHFSLRGNQSMAMAISRIGTVTGYDELSVGGGQLVKHAFVADRFGATTYLPLPAGVWTGAIGYGINSCGLVVGYVDSWGLTSPALWDPGC